MNSEQVFWEKFWEKIKKAFVDYENETKKIPYFKLEIAEDEYELEEVKDQSPVTILYIGNGSGGELELYRKGRESDHVIKF